MAWTQQVAGANEDALAAMMAHGQVMHCRDSSGAEIMFCGPGSEVLTNVVNKKFIDTATSVSTFFRH